MNCVACGSENTIEGNVLNESGGMEFAFKPLKVSMWKAVFGIGVQKVSAYACVHCGHLQLYVNFSDKDKHRYLEFQGQQPGLLERIESE